MSFIPNVDRFSKNILVLEDRTLQFFFLQGRGFRGGSDEKMRRMWLGLGIAVVGLSSLVMPSLQGLCITIFNSYSRLLKLFFFSLIEGDPPIQINVTNA